MPQPTDTTPSDLSSILGPALAGALARKGYAALTTVQAAVLDPALDGRDLRITSQTGSGKTVAVGLALRHVVAAAPEPAGAPRDRAALARPRAVVIAPTRELARQFEEELSWLYLPLGVRVASVTGGSGYGDERRALARGPAVIVGTPGRLLDHLRRGAIDATAAGAVVLDEADRLLDLGFRDDLDAILAFAPEGRRTHLVSATFPREVRALADATQRDPVHVEGTRLGAANADIDHVVHLVDARQRLDAIVNLLLWNPGEQTLVFARTRADVAAIAAELKACGFAAASLSGEMDQAARTRALGAFKRGDLRVLVATDVAARGIDVQDIARVIHAEPPSDADTYTHRSGRTGRAGRKGVSCVLASAGDLARTGLVLRRAGVAHRFEPVPAAEAIRAAADERAAEALLSGDDAPGAIDDRAWALARRIVAGGDPVRAIARLLAKAPFGGPAEPRHVRHVEPPGERPRRPAGHDRATRAAAAPRRPRVEATRPRVEATRPRDGRPPREALEDGPRTAPRGRGASWVPFRVSWGQEQGADARRLLAVACRRGKIRGADVGSIRVGRSHSIIEVASHVADAFAVAAGGFDPRDPRMTIRPERADLRS